MHRTRWTLIVGSIAVMAVILGAGIVWAQNTRAPTGEDLQLPLSDGGNLSRYTMTDSKGNIVPITMNYLLGRVAEIEPSFGGMFRDPENKDVMNVYLTDLSKGAEAEAAIKAVFGDARIRAGGIKVIKADYSMVDLKYWYDELRGPVKKIPEVTMTDLDEGSNRLTVGVIDLSAAGKVRDLLVSLDIPVEAVEVERSGKVILSKDVDSPDPERPIEGGWQIYLVGASLSPCTLGFVTERDGDMGFVTASHCSKKHYELDAAVTPTPFVQPTPNATPNARDIGYEHVDPTMKPCSGGDCSAPDVYRYSDACFALKHPGSVTADQGKIARTENPKPTPGHKTIDTSDPEWRITSEGGWPSVDDDVEYVGKTSGWQSGSVVNTDIDAVVGTDGSGNNRYILNMTKVHTDSTNSQGGDSGAPVFEITNSPSSGDVELHGILVGFDNQDNDPNYVFSSLGYIYMELGLSVTWNSCYDGGGC